VRLSGPDAVPIALRLINRTEPLTPRHATFATLAPLSRRAPATAGGGTSIADQVVLTFFPAPHSATGDSVIEISAHGSPVVLEGIVRAAMDAGARLAAPGEFTLRAFLNGKVDLIQAEAIADLIDAVTPRQARAAFDQLEGTLTTRIREIESALFDLIARLEASLDFPDEGYHFVAREAAAKEIKAIAARIDDLLADAHRGRIIREGAQIAIVGTPNVGKSSLFNALINANRAIVTPIPGTTRDLLTEQADIHGIAVSFVDTAGIRASSDEVEQEGIARARAALTVADLTLLVLDRSRALKPEDRELVELVAGAASRRHHVVVANKTDLPAAWHTADVIADALELSVETGDGLQSLAKRIVLELGARDDVRDRPSISNVRHIALLRTAREALRTAIDAMNASNNTISEEFVLADLQQSATALQEVTGQRTTDDLLSHIFSRFCIGK
jgi:tRNA modification GTPase